MRVTVQLIKAVNDSHLWAESYDRKLSDVFQVESDVAQKIATALEAKLTGREKSDIASVGTQNSQAYDAYLQARAVYREYTFDSLQRAVQALEEAVRVRSQLRCGMGVVSADAGTSFLFANRSNGDGSDSGEEGRRNFDPSATGLGGGPDGQGLL